MKKQDPFNYSDASPSMLHDINYMNNIDCEEFLLYGVALNYYKLDTFQPAFDEVYRDYVSSPKYMTPVQVRGFCKVDQLTQHGMNEIGVSQVAERTGFISFNISLVEKDIGRSPVVGDVIEYVQAHQKFEIFEISKDTHRLGRPLRYKCEVRLYQDTK